MTKAEIFKKKASEIIKESIKSVVYIDEKAWNPFENEKFDKSIDENVISKELYKNLKEDGINLTIHKFSSGEEDLPITNTLKKYLFNDIDLVLLDWDLDGDPRNIASLKLLNDIIDQPHIHFCCIYSSSPDFDSILKKVTTYYSGLNIEKSENIKKVMESADEEIIKLVTAIDITANPDNRLIGQINNIDNSLLDSISKITGKNYSLSLIDMGISLQNFPVPVNSNYYPFEVISKIGKEYTLILNNTVITILQKKDNKPKYLIKNFSNHISEDQSKSFLKLLGLDMQNVFSKKGAFVNPDILNISFNTFLHHRKQINELGGKPPFEDFVKDLLLENARLNLTSSELKILENSFLNSFKVSKNNINDNELALVNCFYNGIKIKENKPLNFGDIFIDEYKNYYLCITALCDCVLHNGDSNIKFKYFFVKGSTIDLSEAFKKEDGGYISYIDESTCIAWTKGQYVKPIQLYAPDPVIIDEKITVLDWIEKCPLSIPLKYVFTLKQNYAQRIANHTFTHPARVGVDFVKI